MFAFKSSVIVAALVVSSYAIPAPDAGAKSFTLQNGKDALALGEKFQTLAANSKCTDGEDACVGGKFAACTGGKFALTQCGAGTVCAALPLVNKPGTAVTCTTETDRDRRIAATGASGADDASTADDAAADDAAADDAAADDAADDAAADDAAADAAAAPPTNDTKSSASAGGLQLQNGKDAVAETAKDAELTPDSPCTENQNACINGQFAQCANGKFVLTPCSGGLKCFTLPLLNKAGTSNTCTTQADATQRIKNSGASN